MSSADSTVPGYVDLYRTGELTRRAEERRSFPIA